MKATSFLILFAIIFLAACSPQKADYKPIENTDANGYKFTSYTNDPVGLRIYTLKNGLKVYLSVNKDEPRIQTYIAVKAGSSFDPKETTGLAHYLEHMMFKGSDKIGTLNWVEEEKLLDQISDLYELHKASSSNEEKAAIYRRIDSVSTLASKYVVANEYDKMTSSLGASGTNAYTSNERTVYINNIPSNEIEKWLMLEKERFTKLVLRLFHTELETVYEEFNMSQDRDNTKAYFALMQGLFPTHPYGTQTTIGKAEHLKNPSMINIQNYYKTYYVPNNMAVCMSGDLDFDNTIKLIDKYFGGLASGEVPKFESPVEKPLDTIVKKEVFGPETERLSFAFRFNGINTQDEKLVSMIDMILNNSKAGLIDLDLVQKQKVLKAGCSPDFLKHYGFHSFYGIPRQGQSLDEVKDLIITEIEKVKKGEFDDWLIQAIVNDLKLNRIRSFEADAADNFVSSFANDYPWNDYLAFIDNLESITKEQIMEFAQKNYNNYVIVYKRQGIDSTVVKVDKPKITPIEVNRTDKSEFLKNFEKIESGRIEPVFVDFNQSIKKEQFNNDITLNYIKNQTNDLFNLCYIVDIGKDNNLKLPLAVNYLPYLGTSKYTPDELQKELYKYGISFDVSAGNENSYVQISGLESSLEKGIELLEHILAEAKPDTAIYNDYVKNILKSRADSKLNKSSILNAMFNYGKYGQFSPTTNIIPESQLKSIDPQELTSMVKSINSYKHNIFYYGKKDISEVNNLLKKYHNIPASLQDIPKPVEYQAQKFDKGKVYFVDYDMVQTFVVLVSKDTNFSKELLPYTSCFDEYFGSGLSSIVFQEIRESKALAYSAYAVYNNAPKINDMNFVYAVVATQADKLKMASDAMLNLLNNMPEAEIQFNSAKDLILKSIETERIIKQNIFWTNYNNQKLGIDYDIRNDIYQKVKTMDLPQMKQFFDAHIKNKNYTFLVLGKKQYVDLDALKSYGEIETLDLQKIFAY